jgi:hypothetical protein
MTLIFIQILWCVAEFFSNCRFLPNKGNEKSKERGVLTLFEKVKKRLVMFYTSEPVDDSENKTKQKQNSVFLFH